MSAVVLQQTQILSQLQGLNSNASMPRIIGGALSNQGALLECEIAKRLLFYRLSSQEQHKIPNFWHRFKVSRDKKARINFL